MDTYWLGGADHHWFSNDQHSKNYVDESCGLVFPWLTKPFLDILKTWNLSQWNVFEWGTGYSTLWFSKHCKKLYSVEVNPFFYKIVSDSIKDLKITNCEYILFNMLVDDHPQIKESQKQYAQLIKDTKEIFDCVIVDGSARNVCGVFAKPFIKSGGVLILDNANQQSIGQDNTLIFEAYKDCEHYSYLHPWHQDWRTDYWRIK